MGAERAKVVLFDEPARGIDVGAKVDVFAAMDRMARGGAAVLMVSSELSELMQVADRILVMRHGRITASCPVRRHAGRDHAPCGAGELVMMQRRPPFFTLIALSEGLSVASPHFLTTANLGSVIRQTAVLNIMALGMTMIIIAGGIDLSVGAILALAGCSGAC